MKLDYINSLRALADFLEAREGLDVPDYVCNEGDELRVKYFSFGQDDFRSKVRALGGGTKRVNDSLAALTVERQVGHFTVVVNAPYGSCEQVQVGTEVKEVNKVVTPAVVETVREAVPVYEWRCPDSILKS